MLRIHRINNPKYFYALDTHDTRVIRMVGILGFVALTLMVAGFINFLSIAPWVSIIFTPILLVITLYHGINFCLLILYPGFDLRSHRKKVSAFKKNGTYPRVAVLIPAAGEDIVVVADTVESARAIDYPAFEVFVLDDSKNAIYQDLARSMHCRYIRRQEVGKHKKAGNMNHALGQLQGYEQILVLDADFKARPEILAELVPYSGADVGIVQSPQHFAVDHEVYKRSKIEYGAAYIQQDFYRITQVARNRFGAAICVGTNALYNIAALKQVGGFEGVGRSDWGHSEDVHTGLKMLNARNDAGTRYQIRYIPVQLAEGYCPDNHHSFYKQQNRWCTGSMQLLISDKTVFSKTLSPMQKLIYASNSLYYFYTIGILAAPLYLFVLTLTDYHADWTFTLLFIPALLVNHVIAPFMLRKQRRPLATTLVVISNAYTFLQALLLLIIRRPLGWEATGAQTAIRKSMYFTYFKIIASLSFITLYILTFGALVMNERIGFGPQLFIVAIFISSLCAQLAFLVYTLITTANQERLLLDRKLYGALILIAALACTSYFAYKNHNMYDLTITETGIGFVQQNPK